MGSFLISLFLCRALYKMRRTNIGKRLAALTVLVSFWLLMEGLSFYVPDLETVLLFQKLKYIGVIFVPPVLVVATIQFIHRVKDFPLWLRTGFFIIPFLSMLSVLTGFPYLFASNPQLSHDAGIPIYT